MTKKLLCALVSILCVAASLQAQNVTIKATNGSMIAAMASGNYEDLGYKSGGFATWQHEQLSMVLTTSDRTALTPNRQLDNPANNLYAQDGLIQVCKGYGLGYVSLSLPSGYRFTGYTIKFKKPGEVTKGEGNNSITFNEYDGSVTFGETGSDFGDYVVSASAAREGDVQTIKRTEMNEGDMSNVLYFKLGPEANRFELITLEYAEFFFTAEENFSPVTPAGDITTPVSAVDIPFSTSRVDYGKIAKTTYHGNSRITYTSANVKDLEAEFVLYEEGSVKSGSDIDGISGKVVDYKDGSISSAAGYFKLGNESAEQVYYIETPTSVTLSDGTKNPVGYRIIGAEFEYTKSAVGTRTFYITHLYNGNTYYLYTNGNRVSWETSQNRCTLWTMDSDGYISCAYGYLYFNNGYAAVQTTKPGTSERFGVDDNNNIYQLGWPDYYIRFYVEGWLINSYYCLVSKDNGENATYTEQSTTNASVGDFTIKVYDKTGQTAQTIAVNDETPSGKIALDSLNNDAVKFGVQGIGLVRATLTLQALDPFLDQMSVVCQDRVQTAIRMKQKFTASDFSVSGGEFHFYLPKGCEGHKVAITFEDLHSKYFDESYSGGSADHTSRLNFVRSLHYDAFGTSNNNVYSNRNEAANAQLERLKVSTVGTAAFKFNNADEVGTSGGTLREYPFSLEKYAAAPNEGSFTDMNFTVTTEDQNLTRYVFTTDETRYNIAPTTATQHRAYAFYQMKVHVQTATYDPKVKFTKIYDKTLYGTGQKDAFYGATITATDGNGNPGYASTDSIYSKIAAAIKNKKDDFGTACDSLKSSKQLLYLDFSQLAGVYEITTEDHQSMEDYSATNAANCIVFLPVGATATNNNVAYKTEGGDFQAAANIVLTDKQPFYTPYDIQVHSANTMTYERKITKNSYGQVKNATIILPFAITVTDGVHTNPDGSQFTLHQLQESNNMTNIGGKTYAYMPSLGGNITTTTANTPYVVHLSELYSVDSLSFVVKQPGAPITATTAMASDYTFTGETGVGIGFANGDQQGQTYTLTSKGSYSGKEIAKDKNSPIFYFANDHFVCSSTLNSNYSTVKVAPFRSYYATQTTASTPISTLEIIFGEGMGTPTGITDVTKRIDTGVRGGDGTITVTTSTDKNVKIYNAQGMINNNLDMQAGETKTVNVPAGIYVVNGVKIIVK